MIVPRLVVAVVLVVSTIGAVGAEPAAASCPRLAVQVEPGSGTAGSLVSISGQDFYNCSDFVSCLEGEECPTEPPPPDPLTGLAIVFTGSNGERAELARVDGPDFSIQATVPPAAAPGPASIAMFNASGDVLLVSDPAPFEVRVTPDTRAKPRAQLPRTGSAATLPLRIIGLTLVGIGAAARKRARLILDRD